MGEAAVDSPGRNAGWVLGQPVLGEAKPEFTQSPQASGLRLGDRRRPPLRRAELAILSATKEPRPGRHSGQGRNPVRRCMLDIRNHKGRLTLIARRRCLSALVAISGCGGGIEPPTVKSGAVGDEG
jgi:hypothetical protein